MFAIVANAIFKLIAAANFFFVFAFQLYDTNKNENRVNCLLLLQKKTIKSLNLPANIFVQLICLFTGVLMDSGLLFCCSFLTITTANQSINQLITFLLFLFVSQTLRVYDIIDIPCNNGFDTSFVAFKNNFFGFHTMLDQVRLSWVRQYQLVRTKKILESGR